MTTIDKPAYRVVGTSPVRPDGLDKVTGAARYASDIHLPGMLHAAFVRSPHAHARILGIDTSRALELPGVLAVVTAADFAITENKSIDFSELQGNARMLAENILAGEKALYQGHAVAAVAAVDVYTAQKAAELIDVRYEPLQPVLTVEDAMRDGAPLLHEDMTTRFRVERFAKGDDTGERSNVAGHWSLSRGDNAAGFAKADVVVEREFRMRAVHQGYIEPHASTATWGPDDRVTVWTSTQSPFAIRAATAAIIGLPEHRVKVVPMEIGGGFGGKLVPYADPVVAMLSRKTGRPVKHVMSRVEEFQGTGPTSGGTIRAKIGATKDGKLVAADLWMAFEAGAFPGSPVAGGAVTCLAPYAIENFQVEGFDVVCNRQKVAAYRAPGQPQANFAVETVVDELAETLGIDPLEFRRLNTVREGDRTPSGVPHPAMGYNEVLDAIANHPHYKAPIEGPNRGRGLAVGYRLNGGNVSSVTVSVNADGSVNVITGAVDIGGSRAAVAMAAAEALGIGMDDVNVTVADTDSIGQTGPTAGSRTTYDTTMAVMDACAQVRKELAARAALTWNVDPADVRFENGEFSNAKGDQRLNFRDLAGRMVPTGGPVIRSAINENKDVGPIFGATLVDVEVDPDTGKVDVQRVTAFMDAGRAIHRDYAAGQLQGGTVQGIGWALHEEYFLDDDGNLKNPSFLDYRIPTMLDVPDIEAVMVEVPNPRHPLGVRGVGEIPIVTPQAAIANAIAQATGVRLTELPMKPGVVLEALGAAAAGKG